MLTQALASVFALPLTCRIHEGAVFSNRDRRTLLDKMILLLDSLGLPMPCYLVVDAYYANGEMVGGVRAKGNHLVTRIRSNSVAFFPATLLPNQKQRRVRPKKYGKKIQVAALLEQADLLQQVPSPVYGAQGVTLRFRPAGCKLVQRDGDWDKEDRTSQGFRIWLRPAKIITGSGAPPPEEKSN